MDLVDCVTQNSNNRNVTMENKGDGDDDERPLSTSHSGAAQQQREPTGSSSGGGQQQQQQQQMSTRENGALAPADAPANKSQVPDYLRAIGMDPRKFWPRKYRFTREMSPGQHNPLTIAQRNFYEANGYLVFDDCASKRLLETVRDQHKGAALANEFLLDKLLLKNKRLLEYAKCFCDERLMLMTHRLIDNFQANDAENGNTLLRDLIDNRQQHRQLLFRDWMYLPFRPIDKVCCAITAVEPLENTLLLVPGTHRVGQCSISSTLDSVSAAYDSSQEKAAALGQRRELFECSPERLSTLVDKSKRGFKYINLKPGQTLFYHPGLIHGFSQDLTNFRKSQLAAVAYYAAADCEYVDLRKSAPGLLQANTNADWIGDGTQCRLAVPITLNHFGPNESPLDYTSWLDKPRLVGTNKL